MKIFGRDDNVLCGALKVSVFVEKIFCPVYIGILFPKILLWEYT